MLAQLVHAALHMLATRVLAVASVALVLVHGAPRAAQQQIGVTTISFTHGLACGDATDSSVVLWTRTSGDAALRVSVADAATGATLVDPATSPVAEATAASDDTAKVTLDGLAPGTRLRYQFIGPNGEVSPEGACETARSADDAGPLTFAFSGDADWKWRPYPLLRYLNAEPLDFFIFLGDLIYETTNPQGSTVVEDLDGYRAKYRENRELPDAALTAGVTDVPMQALYGGFGQYSVFDNHETGVSRADPAAPPYTEGGAPAGDGAHQFVNQTEGWRERVQAYAEYNPVRDATVTGTGDPRLDGTPRRFYAQRWGANAELLVADDRSYRDRRLGTGDDPEAGDPARTMLGTPQLAWLEQELAAAQQGGVTWKFVVVSSPIDGLGRASQVGVDLDSTKSWAGGYRFERDTLLKYIDDAGIDNVVFLTTDDHMTRISELDYRATPGDETSPLVPARNAFQILTGPIGAGTVLPDVKADLTGLSGHDVDRRVVETLVGDRPNRDGALQGEKQAGLPPVGLRPGFPGLVEASIQTEGGPNGVAQPPAFVFFNTDAYAVLRVDGKQLGIRVAGIDNAGFVGLYTAAGQQAYAAEPFRALLQFTIDAR